MFSVHCHILDQLHHHHLEHRVALAKLHIEWSICICICFCICICIWWLGDLFGCHFHISACICICMLCFGLCETPRRVFNWRAESHPVLIHPLPTYSTAYHQLNDDDPDVWTLICSTCWSILDHLDSHANFFKWPFVCFCICVFVNLYISAHICICM